MHSSVTDAAAASAIGREMQLLLHCARRQADTQQMAGLRALLCAELDWSRLVALAARHRMLPLVWWHLRTEQEAIPSPVAALLQRAFMDNAGRVLRLTAELLELNQLFAGAGITVVPYKGPALAAHTYGNIALRAAGDLDLLVRRRDVERARTILLERGYRPRHTLSAGGVEFMLRSRYSQEFEQDDGTTVELHWAFTNGDVALSLDLETLAPRLSSVPLGGGIVPVFGREDLLLILCVHGCKHRWDRLEWLCGVAALLRASSNTLNWTVVLERARALGVRRMLLLGLLLAHDILAAPVMEELIRAARADGALPELAAEVLTLITTDAIDGDGAESLSGDLFRVRLRDRRRDRMRFVWYRLTTPSRPESWSAVAVGSYWLPVHAFLRPFRVAPKLLSALRRYRLPSRASS